MSATHQTTHLPALANHASDHLEVMRDLLGGEGPPARPSVQRATRATRALRGSASLLGLDAFQGFLGRLFVILDDVVSSELPWSSSLEDVLRHALEAEAAYAQALEKRDANGQVEALTRAEAHLVAWRRDEGARFEARPPADDSQRSVSQTAVSGSIEARVSQLIDQLHELRQDTQARSDGRLDAVLDRLEKELGALHADAAAGEVDPVQTESGLRNHCEGGLRQLVEAAAQEVLDEAQECGMRLAIRATGAVHIADDELGGALLEILRNLWSDSRAAQVGTEHAFIDTVFRVEPQRLIVEVRDSGNVQPRHDDDVLAGYSGLRRSRPLIESLQGLVWVEPGPPECRFRLALPRSAAGVDVSIVQVGAREVALPASAVEAVHPVGDVRLFQDATGAFVEVAGRVHPLLNLALVLGDPSFDALQRDRVVIVGSFERRAAILVSGPERSERGTLAPAEVAPWLGRLGGPDGTRLLDVSALLGRRPSARTRGTEAQEALENVQPVEPSSPLDAPVPSPAPAASVEVASVAPVASVEPAATVAPVTSAAPVAPAVSENPAPVPAVVPTVLVVDGSEVERRALGTLLNGSSYRALVARSVDEAWRILETEPVKMVLCDLRLPEMHAQQLMDKIRRDGRFTQTPIVLILSHVGEQAQLVVQQLGVTDFVRSPVRREELLRVVGRLTEESSVR